MKSPVSITVFGGLQLAFPALWGKLGMPRRGEGVNATGL